MVETSVEGLKQPVVKPEDAHTSHEPLTHQSCRGCPLEMQRETHDAFDPNPLVFGWKMVHHA